MPTLQDIHAKLAAIEQKKANTLKDLQVKRAKLKAQIAVLQRPTKSQRRLDARRKILMGAFVLEHLQHTGLSPQMFSLDGERFFDWLVRPNDRAVFETLSTGGASPESSAPMPDSPPAQAPQKAAAATILNVPFAAKDQAKALGAQWHAEQKRRVVPAGLDLAPFKAWLE